MSWLFGPGVFRLFLALLVFLQHSSKLSLGAAAVYVFFCLSGYWIERMWSEKYSATRAPYVTFMVSRLWRLVPTFVLVAAITLGVQLALGATWAQIRGAAGWPRFIGSHLLIFGYNTLPAQPLRPAWSLDVEMQFYVVAPLLAVVMATGRGRLVALAAALISLGSVAVFGKSAAASFLLFFVVGMLAARHDWRPSARLAALTGGAAVALIAGCVLSPFRGVLLGGATPGPLFVFMEPANVVLGLLAMPYAIFTTHQASARADKIAADLSYVVYLLHWAAVSWFVTIPGSFAHRLPYWAAAWALVGVGSLAVWRAWDRPINAARARWVRGRQVRSLSHHERSTTFRPAPARS